MQNSTWGVKKAGVPRRHGSSNDNGNNNSNNKRRGGGRGKADASIH